MSTHNNTFRKTLAGQVSTLDIMGITWANLTEHVAVRVVRAGREQFLFTLVQNDKVLDKYEAYSLVDAWAIICSF